jgi:small-conductance mechanosensitive channel
VPDLKRFVQDMNPLVRGFVVIALIALVVVVLQLQATLTALFLLAQIAFFIAIAVFLYLLWRERRDEVNAWSRRSRAVFFAAILLMVVDVGAYILVGASGPDALAFLLVLGLCGFAVFRVWRDERTLA